MQRKSRKNQSNKSAAADFRSISIICSRHVQLISFARENCKLPFEWESDSNFESTHDWRVVFLFFGFFEFSLLNLCWALSKINYYLYKCALQTAPTLDLYFYLIIYTQFSRIPLCSSQCSTSFLSSELPMSIIIWKWLSTNK